MWGRRCGQCKGWEEAATSEGGRRLGCDGGAQAHAGLGSEARPSGTERRGLCARPGTPGDKAHSLAAAVRRRRRDRGQVDGARAHPFSGREGEPASRGGEGRFGRARLRAHVCGEAAGEEKKNRENRFPGLGSPAPRARAPELSEAGTPRGCAARGQEGAPWTRILSALEAARWGGK